VVTRELPMFPLGSVLFPYGVLPLHVFEPRYRVMTRRCLAGDHEFGVVLIERGSEVGGGESRFGFGTLARIAHAHELPDGRFALTAVGLRRIRVERWLDDDPYPRALVEVVGDEPLPPDAAALRDTVVAALDELLALWRRLDPRVPVPPRFADDPRRAVDEAAAVAPLGPLDAQRVLEEPAFAPRCARLVELLADQAALVRARLGPDGGGAGRAGA
jgi:Lon protease-like protein